MTGTGSLGPLLLAAWLQAAQPVCPAPSVPPPAHYVRRVLVSLNQTINTLSGGEPDETLSSRFGRTRETSKVAKAACWVLDKVDPCHCATSIEFDAEGNPVPHQLHPKKAGS